MVTRVVVRRLAPDDWATFRRIRLDALRDAPHAFGSTYDDERGRSENEWRVRLEQPKFVAFAADGRAVGVVGVLDEGGGVAEIVSMWVAPHVRGAGVGDALIEAAVRRAANDGAREVRLWVAEGNVRAHGLYARHGFVVTGDRQPVREGSTATEYAMARRLEREPSVAT